MVRRSRWARVLLALFGASFLVAGIGLASVSPAQAEGESLEARILAVNDFHGRLEQVSAGFPPLPGAAVLAGAVKEYREAHPNALFVSAGDNVGASTFTSFISEDQPTIESLLAAGVDVSAVGNHEFDRGYEDLRDRIIPAYGDVRFGLGANVYLTGTSTPALAEYEIVETGGVRIGFIGTVTEQTATSVTPTLVAALDFGSQLEAANRVAAAIDDEVDLTVLLAHDGSATQDCASIAGEQSIFGELVRDASPAIDAIISGHTHTVYDCLIEGRPVIQAGFYGAALGELVFELDARTGTVLSIETEVIPLMEGDTPRYSEHPEVAEIVSAAVHEADILGNREVGAISADILRGGNPPGSDRGVESAIGNLVADIMLEALRLDGAPVADFAVMNPGGLRADLLYGEGGAVTYRDVASVLPFANSIFTVQLTGQQLRELLEQQWYLNEGLELKRHLSVSEGFRYWYDTSRPAGARIVEMELHGEPIQPEAVYTVATHTFLVGGGDGFSVFAEGESITDTGRNDLQIAVEYFEDRVTVHPPALDRTVALENVPEPGPEPEPPPEPEPVPDQNPDPEPALDDDSDVPEAIANTGATVYLSAVWWPAAVLVSVGAIAYLIGLRRTHRLANRTD